MILFPPGTGAVLRRELASLSRRKTAYPLRILVLLGLLAGILGLWSDNYLVRRMIQAGDMAAYARFGRDLLAVIYGTLCGVLFVVMPAAVGGAIASERQANRMDLLRMLPLGELQIASEKLLARLLYALYWAVAIGPFFLTPLFFGGAGPGVVLLAVLFPLCAAVWVSSLALLFSALRRHPFAAVVETYAAVAFLLVAGMAFLGMDRMQSDRVFHLFPLTAYVVLPALEIESLQLIPATRLEPLLWQLPLETLAFSCLCMLVAAARIRREAPGGGADARGAVGPARRLVWRNAVAWKEAVMGSGSVLQRIMTAGLALYAIGVLTAGAVILRDVIAHAESHLLRIPDALWNAVYGVGGAALLVGLGGLVAATIPRWQKAVSALVGAATLAAVLLTVVPILEARQTLSIRACTRLDERVEDLLVVSPLVLGGLLAVAAAFLASQTVASERTRGTLDDLRITPLTAPSILDGKTAGCLWSLGPGLLLFALQIAMLAVFCQLSLLSAALALVTLGVTLLAILQAGLWASSVSRGPVRAFLLTAVALAASQAVTGMLLGLYPLVSMTGFYVSPLFWLAAAFAWGGQPTDPDKLRLLAPLPGFPFFWALALYIAFVFRRWAARAFEARR